MPASVFLLLIFHLNIPFYSQYLCFIPTLSLCTVASSALNVTTFPTYPCSWLLSKHSFLRFNASKMPFFKNFWLSQIIHLFCFPVGKHGSEFRCFIFYYFLVSSGRFVLFFILLSSSLLPWHSSTKTKRLQGIKTNDRISFHCLSSSNDAWGGEWPSYSLNGRPRAQREH